MGTIQLYQLTSIEIVGASGNILAVDASGYITANQGGSWSVAVNNFPATQAVTQSGTWNVGITGTVAVTQSGTWTTGRTWVLAQGTDAVTAYQGGTWSFAESAYSSWKTSQAAPTATAAQLVATPLANRKTIIVQNIGTKDCYLGIDNTVSASTGLFLPKGSDFSLDLAASVNIWAISASGTGSLAIIEAA